jgi:hypothetical protein
VEVAPDDAEAHDFGFARASSQFEGIAAPAIFGFGDTQGLQFGGCATKFGDDLGERFQAADFFEIDQGFDRLSLTEEIAKFKVFTIGGSLAMGASKPMIQQLNGGIAGSDVEGFAPVSHGGAEVADEIDRGGSASLHNHGGITWFFGSDTMGVGFCPGCKQGFENGGVKRS